MMVLVVTAVVVVVIMAMVMVMVLLGASSLGRDDGCCGGRVAVSVAVAVAVAMVCRGPVMLAFAVSTAAAMAILVVVGGIVLCLRTKCGVKGNLQSFNRSVSNVGYAYQLMSHVPSGLLSNACRNGTMQQLPTLDPNQKHSRSGALQMTMTIWTWRSLRGSKYPIIRSL